MFSCLYIHCPNLAVTQCLYNYEPVHDFIIRANNFVPKGKIIINETR